jgi:DNA-binding transcriptional LysR family regulator
MNIPDIQAFVAIAEAGSINRAARRLNLTQPAVTRRLQNFEAALGTVVLLDRRAKPPVLTPLGRQVLESCRRVLKAVGELKADASPGVPKGEFRIGVAHGLAEAALSSPLDELRQCYPQVRLRISANWTNHLIDELRSGALDCVIALIDDQTRLPTEVTAAALDTEELVVVAAKSLSFKSPSLRAGRRRLRLHDLADHGWVLNPPGCGYRLTLQRIFDREGLALDVTAEVFGHDLQLSLAARGAGLTVAPRSKFETSADRRALQVVHSQDLEFRTTIALLRGRALGKLDPVADWLHNRMVKKSVYKKRAS